MEPGYGLVEPGYGLVEPGYGLIRPNTAIPGTGTAIPGTGTAIPGTLDTRYLPGYQWKGTLYLGTLSHLDVYACLAVPVSDVAGGACEEEGWCQEGRVTYQEAIRTLI